MLRPTPEKTKTPSIPFKYRLVKAIDVAGLNFLTPVVRLCFGEEPRKQLKDIGLYIVIPVIAMIFGVCTWFVVSEMVVTKSGKLPNPSETLAAAGSIWDFHVRENDKLSAFELTGAQRDTRMAAVESRLKELEPLEEEINKEVTEEGKRAEERTKQRVASLEKKYGELKEKLDTAADEREKALKAKSESIAKSDVDAKNAYIVDVRKHRKGLDFAKGKLRDLKGKIKTLKDIKDDKLAAVLRKQTQIAEERQYLGKMKDQLTKANRDLKVAGAKKTLDADLASFYEAEPSKMYLAASKFVKGESRIDKLKSSEYAKPSTLPFQIKRSLLCVFVGFFIGTAIAVPLGIMCGLSKTVMAAMTPIVALFKPVSPIVWLPVCLIICSAMIPDPDKHFFTQWMWDLPILGKYQINPAFLASACTVALCSLWATMSNTALGVASVDEDHINVARVLRLGFWDRLFKIVLPSALPLVFAGLRISLGVGWMVLIAAELLSSSEGIGKYVWDQFNNGGSRSFANMVVVVFVVGIIGLILDRMMVVFQRLVSFDESPTAV